MNEIAAGIWTWSVFNQEKKLDFNGHLVTGAEGCVLVDPPPMTDADRQQADGMGPMLAIVITNRHHTRDAAAAAARFSAPILIHEADASGLPAGVRIAGTYRDGDHLAAGLLVVWLRDQKSPGESALLSPRANALILGDALIGAPAGSLRMLPDDKFADAARARAGLRRLLDLRFDALLLGDGASIPQGGRRAVESFLERSYSTSL
jgi:glyoxylase-like metal-dependent hydrolase (beta-lactamase superfamily II)